MALVVKNLPANAMKCGFNPWVRKMPWRRAWQPLQYSYLENSMDRGAWKATVHWVAKSQALLKVLNMNAHVSAKIYLILYINVFIFVYKFIFIYKFYFTFRGKLND